MRQQLTVLVMVRPLRLCEVLVMVLCVVLCVVLVTVLVMVRPLRLCDCVSGVVPFLIDNRLWVSFGAGRF